MRATAPPLPLTREDDTALLLATLWWPGKRDDSKDAAAAAAAAAAADAKAAAAAPSGLSSLTDGSAIKQQFASWTDALSKSDWQQVKDPRAWAPPALAVAAALGFSAFYRSYLRRIPTTNHIQPRFFRRRSLLGKVTSVGDGDNFHLFHTPGGRLAGWGWLRKVPTYRKELRGQTIPVRIAGVDAPEGAHFGKPAQPYSGEALDFLTQYLLGRRVRAYLFRRDQYDRVVARVIVRRFLFFKKDVGYEMIKRGLATCYEAKSGAEFGGREAQYRVAEAKAKSRKRGLWGAGASLETPREYKTRMAATDAGEGTATATSKAAATPASTPTTHAKEPAKPAKPATPAAPATPTPPATPAKPSTPAPATPAAAAAAKPTPAAPASPAKPTTPAPAAKPAPTAAAAGKQQPGSSTWGKGPTPGRR